MFRTLPSKLRLAGKIGAFAIYDLDYFGDEESLPFLRSVLVQNGRNQSPTKIVNAGGSHVISMTFDDGGTYHIVIETCFVILASGPVQLELSPLYEAASKAIPSDKVMYQPTSQFKFESLLFSIQTEDTGNNVSSKMACCQGRVDVPFRIEKGVVVPGKATYVAE